MVRIAIAALVAATMTTGACLAADPRYPDWPCAQAKVPDISLAAVWAGPALDDATNQWKDDTKVSALVGKLAARGLTGDEDPGETKRRANVRIARPSTEGEGACIL